MTILIIVFVLLFLIGGLGFISYWWYVISAARRADERQRNEAALKVQQREGTEAGLKVANAIMDKHYEQLRELGVPEKRIAKIRHDYITRHDPPVKPLAPQIFTFVDKIVVYEVEDLTRIPFIESKFVALFNADYSVNLFDFEKELDVHIDRVLARAPKEIKGFSG
jgi:hypothetical protein